MPSRHWISFGDFQLLPCQRLLLKRGMPVEVGSRALDVLIALTDHVGEVVSNRDLVRMVWHDVVVDESCLRVHISALRKALTSTETDVSYIANVPGRGYSFIVSVSTGTSSGIGAEVVPGSSRGIPPPELQRMVGREDAIASLMSHIKTHRFLTICGLGGVGKTTVAVAVANRLADEFDGNLIFLDLSAISDPGLFLGTLASTLGVQPLGNDLLHDVLCFLQDKRMLLLLDSCDHVIDSVTVVAEQLYAWAPHVHLLVTSREPLRAEGECAHRLRALEAPAEYVGLTAAAALEFPAIRLFVDRIAHTADDYVLEDADVPVIADICHKLDAMPLALELVAGQVSVFGIRGVADLLNNRLSLCWAGRRSASPRHQTLNALFDWSFNTLSATEAMVLRRLAVLPGKFSLEVAAQVVSFEVDETQVLEAIGHLVTKSLILAEQAGQGRSYRLPCTLRAYALEKLRSSGEADVTTERHVLYLTSLLERLNVQNVQGEALPDQDQIQRYPEYLENICAALDWNFSESEILRIVADLYVARPDPDLGLAELYLDRSLTCAQRQSALAWELRTAISFAHLHLKQDRVQEAGRLLHSVYGRFSEAFDTHDMRVARQLLLALSRREGSSMLEIPSRGLV
jgi:predicted ATPase/DNA-binding winged helix-turn-helix (wHTH) protein